MLRLLLSDNDDSFTLNLAHLLHAATGCTPHVINHRSLSLLYENSFGAAVKGCKRQPPGRADIPAGIHNTGTANAKAATTEPHAVEPSEFLATQTARLNGDFQRSDSELTGMPQTHSTVAAACKPARFTADSSHASRLRMEHFDLVVISPGPGSPDEYPHYAPLLQCGIPVLGICLGMQIINRHFGGNVQPLAGCVHGKPDTVTMQDVQRTITVGRYHSLHCTSVGNGLEVTGTNPQGIVMALRHTSVPMYGYQFHPESFLTDQGVWCIRHALRSMRLI
ncbi:aminodeoxychorismate/anthranilate synthase component II [Oleidesulfovibrio sp.]|uniref:aminodeoxychorismate/anthranilate synthase component II n=1 Tax=Oleidesulfovibrio sp. TaxID=2909707 RepID=UPI003A87323F